jgi:hypothetical protein
MPIKTESVVWLVVISQILRGYRRFQNNKGAKGMSILALFAKIHKPKRRAGVSSFWFIVSGSGFYGKP